MRIVAMWLACLLAGSMAAVANAGPTAGKDATRADPAGTRSLRQPASRAYPRQWDVPVPAGTALAALRSRYEGVALPPGDLEDRSRLPPWFRAYLRAQYPGLAVTGRYQYPHEARLILDWMAGHPDLAAEPATSAGRGKSPFTRETSMLDSAWACGQWDSESSIAVSPVNADHIIAASNAYNSRGLVGQRQYFSSDRGRTWSKSMLPLQAPAVTSGDPSVAYASDGTAWSATLAFRVNKVVAADPATWKIEMAVQLYRSPDRGANWEFCRTATDWGANDKEMIRADVDPGSPFGRNVHVVWTLLSPPGGSNPGIYFASVPPDCDPAAPPPARTNLGPLDDAIGAHLAFGPSHEGPRMFYAAWPDTGTGRLQVRRSSSGTGFDAARTIGTTRGRYDVSIPAQADRNVLIYLVVAVDQSAGSGRGNVYAVWTDCEGEVETVETGDGVKDRCPATTAVYLSASTDDGKTWSTPPVVVGQNPARTDQFNPWMDVDASSGTVHVAYYQSDAADRLTAHLRHVISRDGGQTWVEDRAVATVATDETVDAADHRMQYGDYNGLALGGGVAFPSWTDRRPDAHGNETKERIYTAAITGLPEFSDFLAREPCLRPGVCLRPEWPPWGDPVIRCLQDGCVVVEPVIRWCPACPKCLDCPASYTLAIDGLRNDWLVDVVDFDGRPAELASSQKGGRLVLAVKGPIGRHALRLRPRTKATLGREYRLGAALEMAPEAPR